MKPTILLIDDHEIVRKGIRRLLEGPTRDICGEAGDGEEAIQKAMQLKPDVILTDYYMPGMKGTELVTRLREALPKSRIIVLTMDDSIVDEATQAGADACIYKGDVVATLNQTIAHVLLGRQLADGW